MMPGRAWRAAAAAVAVLALLALVAGCDGPRSRYAGVTSTVAPRASDERGAKGLDAVRDFESVRGYQATPVPVRVEIARIGVSSRLQRLGKERDATVEVPRDWDVAGWYEKGPRPGDPGSAVLLGHVDSKRGPAVFYRLHELDRGDPVQVVRADGSRLTFTVDRVEQYDKRRFPTHEVYYPTLTPMLRLVTCGGVFDRATGHYRDNVIVFATLAR